MGHRRREGFEFREKIEKKESFTFGLREKQPGTTARS